MNSIWVGYHAIERYASRVWECDPVSLTPQQRTVIKERLIYYWQRSKSISDEECKVLGIYGRRKPGQEYRMVIARRGSQFIKLVLVCGPDDTHESAALKLITVIKIGGK